MRIDGPQITGSFVLNGDTVGDLDVFVTTSSFNMMTSSMATTGSNVFKGTQTSSGSIIPSVNNTYDLGSPTHQFRHVYISTGSLYIDGTKVIGSTSSELQITTDVGQSFKVLETGADTITLQSNDGNVTLTSTGGGDIVMDPSTGVIGLKGTVTIYTGNKITSSDGNLIQFGNGIAITGSIVATGTNLISGSSQVLNGTGIISSSVQLPNGIVSSSSQVTGYGFATTGSNNFVGTQTITGSLYISQNLVVQGSSSLQDVTGSNVYIGTNKINLNTSTPSIRFGGISVFDSGSNFGDSGSLLWDSQNNHWLYQHPYSSGAPYKSAILISGPKNSGSLGGEETLTSGKIMVAVGDDHIGNSIITETNGGIGISGSLSVSGSIVATGTSLWSGSGQLPSGIISGSAQLPSGIISGSAQLPSGTVSGSAQVDIMSTTNIARLATTGSNTFNGLIAIGGANDGAGTLYITASSSTNAVRLRNNDASYGTLDVLNSNASGIGIYAVANKHYISGSLGVNTTTPGDVIDVRRNQNATTNFYFRNTDTTNASSRAYLNVVAGDTTMSMLALHGGDTYLAGTAGRNMYFQQNPGGAVNMFISGSGNIGVNDTSPSKRLSINYGSTQLGGMTVYGSMRQETIFKSTGEHCFLYIDSAHSNTYLPMLSLQRSSTTYAEIRLQRASNSDSYSTFTESEMVMGTTTQTPTSLQMNGSRKLVIDTNGNTNIIGTAIINGALTVGSNGFSLKGWRQYSVQISAGGSTNTGAIIFRQFQDSVNWNTGGVVVEIINYSYAHNEYDTRKEFARYGYSGNAATVNTLYGNVTGKIPQPYWGSAVQGSGNLYYRDLMIDIPPYHAYVISLTTPMSLNGNSTVGNGTIYLFS